jgi:hypothetical protein
MRLFRTIVALAMLACLVPLASLAIPVLVARQTECAFDLDMPQSCVVAGVDVGQYLFDMAKFGENIVATLPIFVGLAILWLLTEILAPPRARDKQKKPASAKKIA